MKTSIQTLIEVALVNNASGHTRTSSELIQRSINEHAALVAVAEAAQIMFDNLKAMDGIDDHIQLRYQVQGGHFTMRDAKDALANLAAVREGKV